MLHLPVSLPSATYSALCLLWWLPTWFSTGFSHSFRLNIYFPFTPAFSKSLSHLVPSLSPPVPLLTSSQLLFTALSLITPNIAPRFCSCKGSLDGDVHSPHTLQLRWTPFARAFLQVFSEPHSREWIWSSHRRCNLLPLNCSPPEVFCHRPNFYSNDLTLLIL